VTYHLKQVGMDSRMLNGGIILTGGGSQLKHLIQLTEYITGLNARIGLPNEHLAPNHIDELKKPMYSTCIGLILKGYNDYEQNYKVFAETFKKVEVPKSLTVAGTSNGLTSQKVEMKAPVATTLTPEQIEKRKSKFWDRFKNNLIDIFSEEEDKLLP
jgi:cell division protein FtsA